MNGNKQSSGWRVNEDKFDADEHNRQIAARDESWGMGRLSDDTFQNAGGLRSKLEELVNSNNTEVNAVLAEHGIENPRTPTRFFLSDKTPCVVYLDDSGWRATAYTCEGEVQFTAATRDGVMLLAEQSSSTHKTPRELTAEERLRVARLAQGGETAQAIEVYVALRLDKMPRRGAEEILTDPTLTEVLNSAAVYVWSCVRPDYVRSAAFDALLVRAAAARPLTVNNVDFLWDRWVDHAAARSSQQAALPAESGTERQPAPTAESIQASFETMSDAEIDRLRLQSLKHRSHLIRRFDERISGGR